MRRAILSFTEPITNPRTRKEEGNEERRQLSRISLFAARLMMMTMTATTTVHLALQKSAREILLSGRRRLVHYRKFLGDEPYFSKQITWLLAYFLSREQCFPLNVTLLGPIKSVTLNNCHIMEVTLLVLKLSHYTASH